MARLSLCLVLLGWPSWAVAAETPAPLSSGQLFQTAGGLLLVLALIVGLAWAVRRFGRLPSAAKGQLEVLGGLSLGARERVVLLKVEGTRLLIGVAPGRVQTLHVLSGAAEDAVRPEPVAQPFHSQLARAVREESS